MRWHNISLFAFFALLCGCATDMDPTRPIWSVGEKRYLSESEAIAQMLDAPFLLLGESHDNPDHHRLQARLVTALAAKGQKRALAFEMIEEDRQPAIDAFLKAHPNQALGLDDAVEWQRRGWPDFAMYAPIFQAGLDGGWPIVGANLAKSKSKPASQPGGLGSEEEALLGLDLPLPPAIHAELRQNLIDGHCGLLPESAIPAMMRLQIAWDGTMAATLADRKQKDGAVLIAGSEHVRKDRAVPYHLARLTPGLNVLTIAFKEQTDPPSSPETEAWPYDLVWFTPPRPEVDHCKELREKMGKSR